MYKDTSSRSKVKPSRPKHTLATRIFHHVSALWILALWALVEFGEGGKAIGAHKALGALFLFWVLLRLINAILRPKVPDAPPRPHFDPPVWQTFAAHATHAGLYFCMIAMAVVGILMSVYGGRPVDVFGVFQIPVFVTPDRAMAGFYRTLHTKVIFPALVALVVLHVGAAFYHQFVLKDNLLSKMR